MKNERISFPVTAAVAARLDHMRQAGLYGSTRSDVVRRIVEQFLIDEFKNKTATGIIDWGEFAAQTRESA